MNDPVAQTAVAMAAFVLSHLVLSWPSLRGRLVAATGERIFQAIYSVIALATLVWASHAFAMAPEFPVWRVPTGIRHLAGAVVLVAFILAFCGVTVRNPAAMMLADDGGELPVPGIAKVTRHPLMWGIALWAIMHVAANGDIASIVYFGGLAVLALAGPLMIDRRRALALGERWQRFAEQTSYVPFAAIFAGRARVSLSEIGLWRILGGIASYVIVLALHETLFGIWPLWVG